MELPATESSRNPSYFEPYIDCKRAAEFLSIDLKTVQRLSREKKIPAHPLLTGPCNSRTPWRYKLSELDEWAQSQRNSPAAGCATSSKEQ